MEITKIMETIKLIIGLLGVLLGFLLGVLRLVAFFTPENRKNLRSNVSEIKAVAAAKKKHLIAAFLFFAVAIAILIFIFWDKFKPVDNNHETITATIAEVGGELTLDAENSNVVEFGGAAGKKIEWIVIEKSKHYWTLLSASCLEAKPYQTTIEKRKKLTWEESSLKKWLNSEFIKNFSESERNTLVEFSEGGFVSLLDIKQAKKLEKENKDLLLCHTESQEKSEAKDWWLQTPKDECVMFVNSSGKIQKSCTDYFDNRADKSMFVRPVIRKKM